MCFVCRRTDLVIRHKQSTAFNQCSYFTVEILTSDIRSVQHPHVEVNQSLVEPKIAKFGELMLTTRERNMLLELQRHDVGNVTSAKKIAHGNILVASTRRSTGRRGRRWS